MSAALLNSAAFTAIFEALVMLEVGLGLDPVPRKLLAYFSKYDKKEAMLSKTLGKMKKEDIIMYPDGKIVALAERGHEYTSRASSSLRIPRTPGEILEWLKTCMSSKERDLFKRLYDGGSFVTKDKLELARDMGYEMSKLSGYDKMLSKWKNHGFVEVDKHENGSVKIRLVRAVFSRGE